MTTPAPKPRRDPDDLTLIGICVSVIAVSLVVGAIAVLTRLVL